jgi:hypothetical protein
VSEFFKTLLDNDLMDKKIEFFELFYNEVISRFIDYIEIEHEI